MTHDDLAAYLYGQSWDQEADRLSAMYAEHYPQSGDFGAARWAKCCAFVLDDERWCGKASAEQREGLRLQARWWRAVALEIEGREDDRRIV